jgi:hypothetical protein
VDTRPPVVPRQDPRTEDNIRRGMAPEEARRAARVRLGGITQLRETHRELHGLPWLETLVQDIRYALRVLRKNPSFTPVAALTLALGIGANTAVFSLVNGVLLRPLPYRDPGRLAIVWEKDDRGNPENATFATYTDWKAMSRSFEELALYRDWQPTLTGSGEPERFSGLRVTYNYFRTLGVRPELGRLSPRGG